MLDDAGRGLRHSRGIIVDIRLFPLRCCPAGTEKKLSEFVEPALDPPHAVPEFPDLMVYVLPKVSHLSP